MSTSELATAPQNELATLNNSDLKQFVTMEIDGQLFGVPVSSVEDVLRKQRITKAPLSSDMILGSINLRGRIVTAINLRSRLVLPTSYDGTKEMHVVVIHEDEFYSFVVDNVGEVLDLPIDSFEKTPVNTPENWQSVALGVYRLKDRIMIVLNIANVLEP